MNLSTISILFIFLAETQLGFCKNILAIFPHFGKSHFFMYQPYVQKLAERGHNVTVISNLKAPTLSKEPNIEVISFGEEVPTEHLNLIEYEKTSRLLFTLREIQQLNEWGQKDCHEGLSHPEVKKLLNSKKHFDLVVVEYFNSDCFVVFSHIFKAPLVGIFSSALMPWHNDPLGNPDNPSYISNMFSGFRSEMSFFERIQNTLSLLTIKMYYKMYFTGPTNRIIKRHLGKGIPSVEDIVKNTSLLLVNSHFSVFQPRPFVPSIVEVGGLHVQPPKKLPADLAQFLDNSKSGVVYFSLGSLTNGSSLPLKKRNAIIHAFSGINMNVLWKWELDDMPDKPKNVMIKKWVPQNDVLAHPNIKLFITHGGLMGTLEALTNGVPMIFIPLFGDQFLNAASVTEKGAGRILDYFSINEMTFSKTLRTMLETPSYAEKAKLIAARFKERPLTPMNNAIYWTEYVLKFKGTPHMKSAVLKLPWYSEHLIDVALFIAISLFSVIYFVRKVLLQGKTTKQDVEEAKKKK